jgi:hypothetical protein
VNSRKLLRRLGVALNLRDPPNVPPYGWSYFDHLVAVYLTLNSADARANAVITKSSQRPDDLTWGDIFLLENIIFSLQPPEVVERSAWIVRERFREITSPSIYDKYIASNVPTDISTPASLSIFKGDLARVLDVLHWYYSLIPIREQLRKSLTINCIALILLCAVILGGILVWCNLHNADFLAMLSCVLYAGIVGGFVSSQRRMQHIPSVGDPLISVFGLDNAGYYLWLSPLLGAIFAVILALMFVAGLLKGSVFPDFFVPLGGTPRGLPFFHFTWDTLPRSSAEYAKLFIWAFLAGFAERLVPDSLDRLASKIDPGDQRAPSSQAATHRAPNTPDRPVEPRKSPESNREITPETIQDAMHTGEAPKEPETRGAA